MRSGLRGLFAGAFYELSRTLDRAVSASTSVAAGLLSFDALGRHAEENWRRFGVGESDWRASDGLFKWELDFYVPHLRPTDRILVVGCGTGRDLLGLLDLGYRTDGLEPVATCAALARAHVARRGVSVDVYTADIVSANLAGRYDVFVFSWFCYGYIAQRSRRIGVLRKLKHRLAPGGRILISYILAEPPPRRALWRLARFAAAVSRADWRPEYGDVFAARYDSGCIHFEHRFTAGEIEAEAQAAGLTVAFHQQGSDGNIALVA